MAGWPSAIASFFGGSKTPGTPSTFEEIAPLAGAALAAYLGYVSSPRLAGRGAALARAGELGLAGYGGLDYLMQQHIQNQLAQAKYQQQQQAIGQLPAKEQVPVRAGISPADQLKYEQMAGAQEANKHIGAQMLQYADQVATTDPKRASLLRVDAAIVLNSTDPTIGGKAMDALSKGNLDELHAQVLNAELAQHQAQTHATEVKTPLEATKLTAETQKAQAETRKRERPEEVKSVLKTIYGPSGATMEVAAGPGYTPPPGWSLKGPSAAAKIPDASTLLREWATANPAHWYTSATEGWQERANRARDYLVSRGIPESQASEEVKNFLGTAPAPARMRATTPVGAGAPSAPYDDEHLRRMGLLP